MDKFLFAGANTPDGFVGYYDRLVDMYNLEKLYILKGGSGIGKSTFIRKFADAFAQLDRDFFVCSGDPKSLDGVIIPDAKVGMIDGTHPHMVDPIYPGIIDEIVNLGEFIIPDNKIDKRTLANLREQKARHYNDAFASLSAAREIHYKIEELYKGAVDFEAIDEKLKQIISKNM